MKKTLSAICSVLILFLGGCTVNTEPDAATIASEAPPTASITAETTQKPTEPPFQTTRAIAADDKSYFFGISPADSYYIPADEWDTYAEIGIKSLRIHLQSGHDWTEYDPILQYAAENDIEVMMLVSYESYDSSSGDYDAGWGSILHFTNSMKLIDTLARAIPYFYNKGVTAFEIWNEQNGTWHLTPPEYAALLTTVYERCKYTDKWAPEATIVFGGMDAVNVGFPSGINGAAQNWFRNFYKAPAYISFHEKYSRSPFDAIGIHPYHTVDVDENLDQNQADFDSAIKGVILNMMASHGDDAIPVWITELGDQDSDDERQAAKLKLYMKTAYANPRVTRFHWFKYTFPGADYSIVREDGTRRSAVAAYSEVVRELAQ